MDAVARIMGIAKSVAGINLAESKRPLVEGRLAKRLRSLGVDIDEYARRCASDPDEQAEMLDLLSTNHTAWLRESAHFDDLAKRVLPALPPARPLRIWCAAAATGEEPYTIAMTVARTLPGPQATATRILATDISGRALAKAKAGRYDEQRVAALSDADRRLALEPLEPGPPTVYTVSDRLRAMIAFARLNLMGPWPMRGPFDVIFCRNVMIYFDQETQERLVNRMAALLRPGGTLYVGHSESLAPLRQPLRPIGQATYAA